MRTLVTSFCSAIFIYAVFCVAVIAGNAHFVGAPVFSTSGSVATVSGKVAGLGNQEPSAANKQTFSSEGDFPVQNGKAYFALDLTAVLQPSCSPPMHVAWSNLSVTVTADDGTYLVYP